jgi:hypothetical protein
MRTVYFASAEPPSSARSAHSPFSLCIKSSPVPVQPYFHPIPIPAQYHSSSHTKQFRFTHNPGPVPTQNNFYCSTIPVQLPHKTIPITAQSQSNRLNTSSITAKTQSDSCTNPAQCIYTIPPMPPPPPIPPKHKYTYMID